MSFEHKDPTSSSNYEVDPRDVAFQRQSGTIRLLDGIRLGLTALALLSGVTILGTSANAVMIYNDTHVSSDFNLPLWPAQFDLRPAVALVVGSTIVILANLVSLIFSKVKKLQNQTLIHTTITFVAPFVGFAAALIGTAFFYAVNASATVDTLQSWSCAWRGVAMRTQPHFGSLCAQSRAALYLSVVLVPLEFVVLAAAAAQMSLERRAATAAFAPNKGGASPALS